MKHEEIYNTVRIACLVGILSIYTFSCSDTRVEEIPESTMEMWVNGDQIDPYEYYGSITTYGEKTIGDDGKVKKLLVKKGKK